ncbi:MAG: hypothetical protein QXI93_04600 [Candidatus Methanomethylicia archaeon]
MIGINRKLPINILNSLISLWVNSETPLTFMEIHKGLYEKKIVTDLKNKMTTTRILKKAIEEGYIRREGKVYYLNVTPEKFRVLDYLQRISETGPVTETIIGGSFAPICHIYSFGMSENILENPKVKFIFELLCSRLTSIFVALNELASAEEYIPYGVTREAMLELIPYYLNFFGELWEERGGKIEDLLMKPIKSLPEKVSQNIQEHLRLLQKISKEEYGKEFAVFERGMADKVFEGKRDFALIIIPPIHFIDEENEERRNIKGILEENRDESPLYIASSLILYDKVNVDYVLEVYGMTIFDMMKLSEIKIVYEKIFLANIAAKIMELFSIPLLKGMEIKSSELKKMCEEIQKLSEKCGKKDIIKYLPFTISSLAWYNPTLEKMKVLQFFFPNHTFKELHDWLQEGIQLFNEIMKKKREKLSKILG